MNDPIAEAMEKYEIPSGHPNFLFSLPPFYVAKSDGKVSIKEAMSIVWNCLLLGLVDRQGEEKKAFDTFVMNKLHQFQGKANLDDFDIVANAINARLEQHPADEAEKIREKIGTACQKVAEASGPLFRDKVLPDERQMLEKIRAKISW